MANENFMRDISRLASSARYLTSVCTGSLILCAAGLLRGKRATTHWATLELLPLFGAIPDESRVVRDGNVITGGGVTAGIDFALVVVAEIFGRAIAESIELRMEYAPAPPFGVGRPKIVPAELVSRARAGLKSVVDANRTALAEAAEGCSEDASELSVFHRAHAPRDFPAHIRSPGNAAACFTQAAS
jgi:cyclohexyl-isocyanide hydratase